MADLSLSSVVEDIKTNPGKFYVYVALRPCGTPFYVGVGRSRDGRQRIQDHAKFARNKDYSRKSILIRSIWSAGEEVLYKIDSWHETGDAVFSREIELISSLGRKDLGAGPLINGNGGGTGQFNPSAEIRAKISATRRATFAADPEASAKASARMTKIMECPDLRARLSIAAKKQFSRPGAGAAVSAQNYRRFSDPSMRAAASERAKKQGSTDEAKAAFLERINRTRQSNLLKAAEARRADPTFRSRMSAIKKQQAASKSQFRGRVIEAALRSGMLRVELPVNRAPLIMWIDAGRRLGVEVT